MNEFNSNNSTERSVGDDAALTALLRGSYAAPTNPGYWAGFEQRVMTQVSNVQLLKDAYAAPADSKYWGDLEQRVMRRVREQSAWWTVLPEWRGAGMIAAAAALFLVGVTTVREQQRDALAREHAAMAAEARVVDTSIEPMNMAINPNARGLRGRSATPERYIDLIRP